jgi:hypothetical protein
VSEVPPTPVTQGWLAGSSTLGVLLLAQSCAPLSPEAAKTACPWLTASMNRSFSAPAAELPCLGSHNPHDVETTSALFWDTIAR